MVRKKVKLYYFTKIVLSRPKTDLKIYALFLLFLLPFYRPFFWLQERKLKSCVAQPFLFTSLGVKLAPPIILEEGRPITEKFVHFLVIVSLLFAVSESIKGQMLSFELKINYCNT